MAPQTILFDGKPYVILPRDEYDRLTTLSKAADLPDLPAADANGNYPAVEYAGASLARKIIRDRVALGWSQVELSRRSGVRVETLCRLETGKVTPALGTVDKLDRALRQGSKPQSGEKKPRKQNKRK